MVQPLRLWQRLRRLRPALLLNSASFPSAVTTNLATIPTNATLAAVTATHKVHKHLSLRL